MPNTVEPRPPVDGAWVSAWSRAETIGARFSEAIATAALSITRLMIMSVTSAVGSTGSVATCGDLPGELVLARQVFLAPVDADGVS